MQFLYTFFSPVLGTWTQASLLCSPRVTPFSTLFSTLSFHQSVGHLVVGKLPGYKKFSNQASVASEASWKHIPSSKEILTAAALIPDHRTEGQGTCGRASSARRQRRDEAWRVKQRVNSFNFRVLAAASFQQAAFSAWRDLRRVTLAGRAAKH